MIGVERELGFLFLSMSMIYCWACRNGGFVCFWLYVRLNIPFCLDDLEMFELLGPVSFPFGCYIQSL